MMCRSSSKGSYSFSPGLGISSAESRRAIPKLIKTTREESEGDKRIFAGLISRWTMLCA